jgi:hypothetical protein
MRIDLTEARVQVKIYYVNLFLVSFQMGRKTKQDKDRELGRVVREVHLKITGSNPSGGSELTFRSDLLLTARGGST